MVVTHDDVVFGSGTDVARLEIASAEHFGLNLAPPAVGDGWPVNFPSTWCAYLLDGVQCGRAERSSERFVARTEPGDSGAGVYDAEGRLVGIVVEGSATRTKVVPMSTRWLEGT
jgi:hypothetical protein